MKLYCKAAVMTPRVEKLKSFSGQDSRLTVTVKQNLPRVQCFQSVNPPVAAMCNYIPEDMPASKAQKVFGARGTAGVDVPIPWTMATREFQHRKEKSSRCKSLTNSKQLACSASSGLK